MVDEQFSWNDKLFLHHYHNEQHVHKIYWLIGSRKCSLNKSKKENARQKPLLFPQHRFALLCVGLSNKIPVITSF